MVIEVLSPSNKRSGEDREPYLAKRRELLDESAHLVEIDLLRGWKPMPLEDRPECNYSAVSGPTPAHRPDVADPLVRPAAGHSRPVTGTRR